MRKICEWSKCKELASGQGLIKKDINKQYKWFCGDHLKIHNKTNDNSCDWKRCKQPGEFKAPSKAVPVATRGIFTLADTAIDWVDANMAPNAHLLISTNAGKVSGLAASTATVNTGQYTFIGRVLGTGTRVSQNGKSDYFAGTGTAGAKYALVQFDCVNPASI